MRGKEEDVLNQKKAVRFTNVYTQRHLSIMIDDQLNYVNIQVNCN